MMTYYKKGYLPGVFDLFHIGHLELIEKSKNTCEYLIVGVLSDELVEHFKGKKPIVPLEDRMAIIKAIKYVDQVVVVDFETSDKILAQKKYGFDCHFSGDDHLSAWKECGIYDNLKQVGADMVCFEYCKKASTTSIKQKIIQDYRE